MEKATRTEQIPLSLLCKLGSANTRMWLCVLFAYEPQGPPPSLAVWQSVSQSGSQAGRQAARQADWRVRKAIECGGETNRALVHSADYIERYCEVTGPCLASIRILHVCHSRVAFYPPAQDSEDTVRREAWWEGVWSTEGGWEESNIILSPLTCGVCLLLRLQLFMYLCHINPLV